MSGPAFSGRLLAIGDIHGCREQLTALLVEAAPAPTDRLVFVGDYIDRGPDSAGVIDDLLQLRQRLPHCVFLRGNHEEMFLDFLAGGDPTTFVYNGGNRTIASYRTRGLWPPPPEHLAFLAGLPCYHETTDFIFVHAGLRPGLPPAQQDLADLLWIRTEFLDSDYDWGKTVVFGHTPREQPVLTPHRIGLDTGCVFGGRLTCCDVLTRQVWQVECLKRLP